MPPLNFKKRPESRGRPPAGVRPTGAEGSLLGLSMKQQRMGLSNPGSDAELVSNACVRVTLAAKYGEPDRAGPLKCVATHKLRERIQFVHSASISL